MAFCNIGMPEFARWVLALINRQKAEIEAVKAEKDKMFEQWKQLSETTKRYYADLYKDAVNYAKTEAIREFAERLKTHRRKMSSSDFGGEFWDIAVLESDIDNLVREMTEEK